MPTDDEDELYQAFLENGDSRLIAPAENDVPSVEFVRGEKWRECRIWRGYIDASFFLLREALRKHPCNNSLIFPAMFNLRHGIEVSLKWYIEYGGGTVPARAGHNLSVLLEALQKLSPENDGYLLLYLSNIISEIESIDRKSVAFRYANEKNGHPIEITPIKWDLRHLYFTVSELSICLDSLEYMIDQYQFKEN